MGESAKDRRRQRMMAARDAAWLSQSMKAAFTSGDEMDPIISARYLGDPTQFWRVADANNALDPFHLVTMPGRVLRIPVPRNTAQP